MAALPPTAKEMPELSMLTYLIEAAAAVKHKDGDTSMQDEEKTKKENDLWNTPYQPN